MRNKKYENVRRFARGHLCQVMLSGVTIMLIMSLAFNLEVTIFTILWGVMLGAVVSLVANIVVIHQISEYSDMKFELDLLVAKGLDTHRTKIKELEKKVEELENRRH